MTEGAAKRGWYVLCLVWAGLLTYAFFPGILSPDSVEQLAQGDAWRFTTNPLPLLAVLNGLSLRLVGSPWPLIALQLLLLSLSLAAVLHDGGVSLRRRCLGVFLLAPTIWAPGVVHWRDVMMAAFLALAVASIHWRRWVVACLALAIAGLFRHNAVLAIAPLAVVVVRGVRPNLRWWKQLALAGALVVGLQVTERVALLPLQPAENCPTCALLLHDLSELAKGDRPTFDESVMISQVSYEDLMQAHAEISASTLIYRCEPALWCNDMFWYPPPAGSEAAIEGCRATATPPLPGAPPRCLTLHWAADNQVTLQHEWVRAVRRHPLQFLRIKTRRFATLLGIGLPKPYYPFQKTTAANWFGIADAQGRLTDWLRLVRDAVAESLFFRGWVWVLLAAALLGIGLLRRSDEVVGVATSGVLYAIGYFAVAPAADFRYLYWAVVSVFFAAACLRPAAPEPTAAKPSQPN